VYAATLKHDVSSKVAIKVLDKKSMDTADLASLKNEVGVMQTIDHPNIVKYIETYNDERYLYLVMQMCEGGTLFDKVD
jgi:calcium-dependent protein kinase